jgi:p-aminobenzoyl-glutamate transporter AbgT
MDVKISYKINKFLCLDDCIGSPLLRPESTFALKAFLILTLSGLLIFTGLSVPHAGIIAGIRYKDLFITEEFYQIIAKCRIHFMDYNPLGTLLLVLPGKVIAKRIGLTLVGICKVLLKSSSWLLTRVRVFCGKCSIVVCEVIYLLFVTQSALLFQAVGAHALGGRMASITCVFGGMHCDLSTKRVELAASSKLYRRGQQSLILHFVKWHREFIF